MNVWHGHACPRCDSRLSRISTLFLFRQPRQHRQLLQILPYRTRRSPPEHNPLAANDFLRRDAGLRSQNRTFFDAHMVGDAYLTTDYNIIFHHGAAGEPGLRRDDHIFSNLYVVANMHQVVDLRPAPDARYIQRSAVNGCVCSDLDVVFNFQSADLGELLIASGLLIADVAESVAAQYRARMNYYSITNSHARIDRHVRIQFAVASHRDVGSHHASRPDSCVVAELHTLAEHHISAHI